MRTQRWTAIAAGVLLAGLGGCEVDAGPPEQGDTGLGVRADAVPADAVPARLQGTWRLDVYCATVAAHAERGGFGEIVERPTASEGRPAGPASMTITLYPDFFEISWRRPDRTWQPGWSGRAHVEGSTLHLDHRNLEGDRDLFSWSLDGDRLALHEQGSGDPHPRGSASVASSVALVALPWTAVDCPSARR